MRPGTGGDIACSRMLDGMKLVFDAWWRALVYSLMPRLVMMSLAPLLLALPLGALAGWLFWVPATGLVDAGVNGWAPVGAALDSIEGFTGLSLRPVLAPLLVLLLAVPLVVVLSVLLVAWMLTPTIVRLVAQRRFPQLQARQGAGTLRSVAWSLGCAVAALGALVLSLPLWLLPPVALLLPPVIWGWLTARVMGFDALAEHADAQERKTLLREHRWPLLAIGVACGWLGAAPALIWAAGALTVALAPLFLGLSLWLYMLVFVFCSLWFTHYLLAALQALRERQAADSAPRGEIIDITPVAGAAAPVPGASWLERVLPPMGSAEPRPPGASSDPRP
ncbi:MAG: hypothetical protein RLY78_3344 [Pseudomonadota bacterium]|jgi:hypothetical protein